MGHFKVFGREVPIRIEQMDDGDFGEYRYKEKEIIIAKDQLPTEIVPTMVHELGHAVCDRIALNMTDISDDMWEVIIENMTVALFENFDVIPKEHTDPREG